MQIAKNKSERCSFLSLNWFVLCDLVVLVGATARSISLSTCNCNSFLVIIWFLFYGNLHEEGPCSRTFNHFVFDSSISFRASWEWRNEERKLFCNGKCEIIANFSATNMVTIVELQNEGCEFWARESVNSSPARQRWRHFRISVCCCCCCCCCCCIYLFWVGNPTDIQSTPRMPTYRRKKEND